MAVIKKFPKKPAKPPVKRKSMYEGVESAEPKDPMPHAGLYRFRVLNVEAGYNQGKNTTSHKVTLEIVAGLGGEELDSAEHSVGDTVLIPWVVDGAKSAPYNRQRVKAFTMNAAGYETDAEYNEFDPAGEFIDSTAGVSNDYSEAELTIIGRLVDCQVMRGKPTADGKDYFREYAWFVVPDEDQDVLNKVGSE
jgi:hypothetical protein